MGSFASKAGRIGPTAAVRRYPKRDPTTNAATAQSSVAPQRSIPPAPEDETAAGPRVHTTAEPSGTRSEGQKHPLQMMMIYCSIRGI